jgi:hypothetical protein
MFKRGIRLQTLIPRKRWETTNRGIVNITSPPTRCWRSWRRWLGGYVGLETLPGIVGTAMLGISATEMMLSTAVRMSVLYAWKGPGPWMAAAIWGTAFQVVIMPGRWALEWGQNQGEVIAQAMEAKVGGANLPIDGGGTGSNNRN